MLFANILLILVLLSVLLSLRANRLLELVKLIAFQGVVVSAVPLFIDSAHGVHLGIILFFLLLILVKGIAIPAMMFMAVKKVVASREIEPIIGYHASLLFGLIMIVFSVYITRQLHVNTPGGHTLLMITAITTIAAGLFLLMARRKAITQVIGYLIMENGIYLMGTALAEQVHTQHIVEFAVLLDLMVGVLVMGIVVNNIHHSFDDVDTTFLGQLRD